MSQTDGQVVEQVLAGRREAFRTLVERHLPMVQALTRARLGRWADADDVAQDVFLKAFVSLDTLRTPTKFRQWLGAIVRNACTSLLRARRETEPMAEERHVGGSTQDDVERRELHEVLRREIARLDAEHREVLLLHYFAGMKIREVAEALDITSSAANKRLQRARKVLGQRILAQLEAVDATAEVPTGRVDAIMGAVSLAHAPWQVAVPATPGTPTAGATTGAASAAKVVGGLVAMKKAIVVCSALLALGIGIWLAQTSKEQDVLPGNSSQESDGLAATLELAVAQEAKAQGANDGEVGSSQATEVPSQTAEDPSRDQGAVEMSGHTSVTASPSEEASEEGAEESPPEESGMVDGIVVDAGGNPVAGALILVDSSLETDPARREERAETRSGPDGTFHVSESLLSEPRVYAWHPDYAPGWTPASREGDLRIVLSEGGAIQGIVTIGGEPWPDQMVSVFRTYREQRTSSGADGAYAFEKVAPGECTVFVETQGSSRMMQQTAVVEKGKVTVVDFEFEAQFGVLEGTVFADGAPIGPGDVMLVTRAASEQEIATDEFEEDGFYQFWDVAPGPATLRIDVPFEDGVSLSRALQVEIGSEETTVVDVAFDLGTALDVQAHVPESAKTGTIAVLRGDVEIPEITHEAFMGLMADVIAAAPSGRTQHRFVGLAPGSYLAIALFFPAEDSASNDTEPPVVLFASERVDLQEGQEVSVQLYVE